MKPFIHIALAGIILTIDIGASDAAALETFSDITCAPTRPEVAAALGDGAVYLTKDGGRTWSRVPVPRVKVEDELSQTDESMDADTLTSDDIEQTEDVESPSSIVDAADAADSAEARARIAVDDRGNIAKGIGKSVIVFGGKGIRRLRFRSAIVGVAFDATGRLFALSVDGVWGVTGFSNGSRLLFFVPLRAARQLIRGPRGSVRVLTRDGIYAVDEDDDRRKAVRLVAVSAAVAGTARFGDGGEEAWLVAAGGEIASFSADGDRQSLGIFAGESAKIAVDAHGAIRLFDPREGWREYREGRVKSLSLKATAVDASGRFWTAGASGLQPPVPDTGNRNRRLVEPHRQNTGNAAVRLQQKLPTPPRCRRYRAAFLPEAVAAFRYRKSAHWEVGERRALGADGSLSFGISLVWRAGGEKMDACLLRHRRFQQNRLRETRRAAALSGALVEAERRLLNATSLKDAIDASCARDRASALLELGSRVSVIEKEL